MNTVSQVLKLIPTDMHIHMQNENKIRNLNEVKTIETEASLTFPLKFTAHSFIHHMRMGIIKSSLSLTSSSSSFDACTGRPLQCRVLLTFIRTRRQLIETLHPVPPSPFPAHIRSLNCSQFATFFLCSFTRLTCLTCRIKLNDIYG